MSKQVNNTTTEATTDATTEVSTTNNSTLGNLELYSENLKKSPTKREQKEDINYFQSEIDRAEEPVTSGYSKEFRLLVDGDLTDDDKLLLTEVLKELHELGYILNHTGCADGLEDYIEDSGIKVHFYYIGEKYAPVDIVPYFVKPWNKAYRISAWVVGTKKLESGVEVLILNTWKRNTRIFQALKAHLFLGENLDERQRFTLSFSPSGVDNSNDINYKLQEYNNQEAVQWAEKLNYPLCNLGTKYGVEKFISLLNILQEDAEELEEYESTK